MSGPKVHGNVNVALTNPRNKRRIGTAPTAAGSPRAARRAREGRIFESNTSGHTTRTGCGYLDSTGLQAGCGFRGGSGIGADLRADHCAGTATRTHGRATGNGRTGTRRADAASSGWAAASGATAGRATAARTGAINK